MNRPVPPAAAWLGGAGAIPFVVGAAVAIASQDEFRFWTQSVLAAYGACILSFLGGIHWGLAIAPAAHGPHWSRLGFSVVPALIAWLTFLFPMTPGLLLLALAFAVLLAGDFAAVRMGWAPPWYPRLRVPLTVVVLACLVAAAVV